MAIYQDLHLGNKQGGNNYKIICDHTVWRIWIPGDWWKNNPHVATRGGKKKQLIFTKWDGMGKR